MSNLNSTITVNGFTLTNYDDGFASVSSSFSYLQGYPENLLPDWRAYPIISPYSDNTGYWIKYDFGSVAVNCDFFRAVKGRDYQSMGTFKLQGSNDDITWVDMITGITDIGTTGIVIKTIPSTPVLYFRYWRLLGVGGSYAWFDSNATYNKQVIALNLNIVSTRSATSVNDDGTGGGANDPGGVNDPTEGGLNVTDLTVDVGDMILNWFRGDAFGTPPSSVWVALFDGDPLDTVTPGVELTNANGLTRQEITFTTPTNRYIYNAAKLSFGVISSTLDCAAFALFDDNTTGTMLTRRMLDAPVTLDSGKAVAINAGKLPLYY